MIRTLCLLAFGMVLVSSGLALAGVLENYQAMYGPKEKDVRLNLRERAAPFAADLLAAAKSGNESKEFRAILCEKAYEFGMKEPAGYTTAIEAAKMLTVLSPKLSAKWVTARDASIKAFQTNYDKSAGEERKRLGNELAALLVGLGDEKLTAWRLREADAQYRQALIPATSCGSDRLGEINDKIQQVKRRLDLEGQRSGLVAQLEKTPRDPAIRTQLVMMYLGEFEAPEEAAKLATEDADKSLAEHVKLAGKKVEDLDEAECLSLAQWYEREGGRLAVDGKLSKTAKKVIFVKAAACIERYLTLHPAQDANRLAMQKLLDRLDVGPKFIITPLSPEVSLKCVFIPAGEFVMGSPAGEAERMANELQHKVKISKRFYLGETEVTQKQWATVMDSNPGQYKGDDLPAAEMTWDDAAKFCKKLSEKTGKRFRLPTEAEWEYACRAGTTTAYYTGDDERALSAAGWYGGNANGQIHPVGKKKPNAWGLYDMHGNVQEWVEDWYEEYPAGPVVDPKAAETAPNPVSRGGNAFWDKRDCRAAFRHVGKPEFHSRYVGCRVALDVP